MPGDLIALGTLLLTLGPERDCNFIIGPEDVDRNEFAKVLLRLPDGRRRVVGVRVFSPSFGQTGRLINPLPKLSADEIHQLWGVYIDAWSNDIAEELRHVDPARTCITVAGNALIRKEGKNVLPPLPNDIQYLNTEGLHGHVENGEPLRQWTQLRFLRIEGDQDKHFDARWLAHNRALCRLDLIRCTIEHPEAFSQLDQLESLDLSDIPNLATVEFAELLTRLRTLGLANTAVWNVYALTNIALTRLDVSNTKVSDLSSIRAKNLENVDVSATMVRDLLPLRKLRNLKKITATYSTVEKLPTRPMPALRTLTVVSTPLSQASIAAFAKVNPKCDVIRRRADALRFATAGATRLRIRSGGMGYSPYSELLPYLHPEETLFEIVDPLKIAEFVHLIEVDEKGPDLQCMCYGEPSIEFYRGDALLATMNWKHDLGFEWPGALTPQSLERSTKWLAEHGYAALHEGVMGRLAAEKLDAEQHAAIIKCYPERARRFFERPDDEDDDDEDDATPTDENASPFGKPSTIADAVGDPVRLAVITYRAAGAFQADRCWDEDWTGPDPYLVIEACRDVSGDDLLKALERSRGDKQAELGAARLFVREKDYQKKIPVFQQQQWMSRFAATLLDRGEGKPLVAKLLKKERPDRQTDLTLREIARGKRGRDGRLESDEMGLRAYTYLALAENGYANIQPEVEALLAKTARKPDIAALEIALAFLGDPKHLKPEHLKADSPVLDDALSAIENFNGREGLDVLVKGGLDNSSNLIRERSLCLLGQITKQHWPTKKKDGEATQFRGDNECRNDRIADAKKWWREHGAAFVAHRRAEKPDGSKGGRPANGQKRKAGPF
jgi:Leucine-rich repeat (LRR) protein